MLDRERGREKEKKREREGAKDPFENVDDRCDTAPHHRGLMAHDPQSVYAGTKSAIREG